MARKRVRIAVVTDSTAYLPKPVWDAVTVVPLSVVLSGVDGLEGVDISAADVAAALEERRPDVTTSRPSPQAFVEAYDRLFASGAKGIVSAHLSSELSGTYESAALAATDFGDRVAVVDTRSTGMGLGFPTLAAVAASAAGEDLEGVRAAAVDAIGRTTALFYVDSLEFLRRGGRIGAASALLGTALSVKPILLVKDGSIVVHDKVRTASRALARLVDLAVEAAGDGLADVAVHHLRSPERAQGLLDQLRERLGDRLVDSYVSEVGAAVAVHVGPGLASVVVHRRP